MKLEDKGSQRLRRMLADPDHAQRVAEIREGMREMDRVYAMNLAMIRKAAELVVTVGDEEMSPMPSRFPPTTR